MKRASWGCGHRKGERTRAKDAKSETQWQCRTILQRRTRSNSTVDHVAAALSYETDELTARMSPLHSVRRPRQISPHHIRKMSTWGILNSHCRSWPSIWPDECGWQCRVSKPLPKAKHAWRGPCSGARLWNMGLAQRFEMRRRMQGEVRRKVHLDPLEKEHNRGPDKPGRRARNQHGRRF